MADKNMPYLENQGLPLDAISCTVDSNPSNVVLYQKKKKGGTGQTDATLFFLEYTFSDETLAKLESMEKEAVVLVEKDQDTEKALSILNQCIDMEKNYASAYNNR